MKQYAQDSSSGTTGDHQVGDVVQLVTIERLQTFPKEVQIWYVENVPEELLGRFTTITKIYRSLPGTEPFYLLACCEEHELTAGQRTPFYDEDFMPPPGLEVRKNNTLPMI